MPMLPDSRALGERPVPQSTNAVASIATGNPLHDAGAQFSAAGREAMEAAAIVTRTNERQDMISAQAASNSLTAESQNLQIDPKSGFANVKGGAAARPEFVTDYTQRFKDAQAAIRANLPNENQQRIFDQHADVAGLHFRSALLQHQAVQTDAFNDATENNTMDLARRSIFQNPGNAPAFQAGLAQINWAIDQKAQRQGWSPETTADVKAKYLEKVHEDAATLDVERDPRTSLALLNKRIGVDGQPGQTGNASIDALDTGKLVELRRRAMMYVARDDAADRSELDKRNAEALKATNELQTFMVSGAVPTPEYATRVKAATVGTVYEKQANDMVQMAMVGAGFGAQSLPRQKLALDEISKTFATGTSPEFIALHKQFSAINETQTKAYTESPWDAWTKYGRGPQTPAGDLTLPGAAVKLVSQRVGKMDALETETGFPVSPLKPEEAVKWADKLAALAPDARASELGAVGAQLSAPRIQALANQIDAKNRPLALALKLGADQTTAGRNTSSLVLAGAQALADKEVKRDDTVLTGWRAEISGMVRGTMGPNGQQAENDIIDAAYFVRAAMDRDGIAVPGFKLDASTRNAVKLVIGEPLERNGVKTLLPRGMDESAFDTALAAYTPDVLRGALLAPGMTERGNIDLAKRPQVKNEDGSISTVRSMGVNIDGKEVLIPTVSDDGRIMGDQEAIDQYRKSGRHLGKFATPDASTEYAMALHDSQASFYGGKGGQPGPEPVLYLRGQPITLQRFSDSIGRYGMTRDGDGRFLPGTGGAFVTVDKGGQLPLRLNVKPPQ